MTPGELVIDRLLQIAAVTALVGSGANARIRHLRLFQSEATFPIVLVRRVDEVERMHLRGASGMRTARVQVEAIALEGNGTDYYAEASALDDAIHGAGDGTGLCGYTGTLGGSPGVRVQAIWPAPEGAREEFDAEELRQFKIGRDYFVTYAEN